MLQMYSNDNGITKKAARRAAFWGNLTRDLKSITLQFRGKLRVQRLRVCRKNYLQERSW